MSQVTAVPECTVSQVLEIPTQTLFKPENQVKVPTSDQGSESTSGRFSPSDQGPHCSLLLLLTIATSVDPDQTSSISPSYQGPHCSLLLLLTICDQCGP